MRFPHGRTVYRLRPGQELDPYAEKETPSDWGTPEVLPLRGAFIAQSSTSTLSDPTRSQALEAKSLYCQPGDDVQKGDRIRDGDTDDAPVYTVDGIPAADTNPFTGWQPVREVPLGHSIG